VERLESFDDSLESEEAELDEWLESLELELDELEPEELDLLDELDAELEIEGSALPIYELD